MTGTLNKMTLEKMGITLTDKQEDDVACRLSACDLAGLQSELLCSRPSWSRPSFVCFTRSFSANVSADVREQGLQLVDLFSGFASTA